eukprot:scpid20769/ scgid8028/ Inactive phospholipase C-like protein 2; Phospholipase C-epsilon-2
MSESCRRRVSFFDDNEGCPRLRRENGCFELLTEGACFVKVRSRCHYPRLFKLEDDFTTLTWSPSAKSGRVFIKDIHEIRCGRNSPLLLDPGLEISDGHAFSIVHGPDFEFLDLVAETEEEACIWQSVLIFLCNLQRRKSGKDEDNISQVSGGGVNFTSIRSQLDIFIKNMCVVNAEVQYMVARYGNGWVLTARQLRHFLISEQKLDVSMKSCAWLICENEPAPENREKLLLSAQGLVNYLYSKHGDVVNPNTREIYQDMTQPLCNYYIASSHNSYLSTSQREGVSSLAAFQRVIMKGCRYVEIDLWDGVNKEPVVRHNSCAGGPLELSSLVQMIARYAFLVSEFPLIIRVEHHCSVQQQKRAAQIFQEHLAEFLVETKSINMLQGHLPSPVDLKGKIILVTKRLPFAYSDGGKADGFVSEDDDMFELSFSASASASEKSPKNKKRPLRRGSTFSAEMKTAPLSRNNSWCASLASWPLQDKAKERHFTTHGPSKPSVPILTAFELVQLSSIIHLRTFSETELTEPRVSRSLWSFNSHLLCELETHRMSDMVQHHQTAISRAYPAFSSHDDSSNYLPTTAWSCGVQCVALNWQTICTEMDLTVGMFSDNGACGYVLKPRALTQGVSTAPNWHGVTPMELTIKIISGKSLPDPFMSDYMSESLDPFVKVTINGASCDNDEWKTRPCRNNRDSPRWDESVTFKVQFPEIALVRFHVIDADSIGSDFIGQLTIPLRCMKTGYRHVKLKSPDDRFLEHASLLVHITCQKVPCYSNFAKRSTPKSRKEALTSQLTLLHELDSHFKKCNMLLNNAVDLCYPAEAALHDLKHSCHFSGRTSIPNLVHSLAAHNNAAAHYAAAGGGKKDQQQPVSKLSIEHGLFPIVEVCQDTASDFFKNFVINLNKSLVAIRHCLLNAPALLEEIETLLEETSAKWPCIKQTVGSTDLKVKHQKKALVAFYWNVGLLEMEAGEIKDTVYRLQVAMNLIGECLLVEGLADWEEDKPAVEDGS